MTRISPLMMDCGTFWIYTVSYSLSGVSVFEQSALNAARVKLMVPRRRHHNCCHYLPFSCCWYPNLSVSSQQSSKTRTW